MKIAMNIMRFFCVSYVIQVEEKPAEYDHVVVNSVEHPSRSEMKTQIAKQFGCDIHDLTIVGISEFKSEKDACIWKGSEPFFDIK